MGDQLLIIPEFILHDYISKALLFLRADYNAQVDKSMSYLSRVTNMVGFERYDYGTQALEVFLKDVDDPKYLEAHLMWNMVKESTPSIHVTLPAESQQSGANGMGMDEGYLEEIFIDSTYNQDGTVASLGSSTAVFTRRYQAAYNIVIVSDNSNEIILIYHVLRALLVSMGPSLALAGLQNITIGGNDLSLKADKVPQNMYIKSISVNLQYESSAPNIFSNPLYQGFLVKGVPTPTVN